MRSNTKACQYESITQCNLSQQVLVLECLEGLRFFYTAGSSSGQGPGRGWHCLYSRLLMWHQEAADYCSHVDYTIEKPIIQVKIARMQVHLRKFLAIDWGPQNVVAELTSSHAWQPIALQLRGDCSIRRFKQIQLIWMMRCCYPCMTGWTLGGNISAQVEELRMDASSKGRTWLQEKMAMMKQGDLRKVAAASGVSTRGEDGSMVAPAEEGIAQLSRCHHWTIFSTRRNIRSCCNLLQVIPRHARHLKVLVLECLEGLRFFYTAGSSSGQGPGRGWHCLYSRLLMWHPSSVDSSRSTTDGGTADAS